jgi:hypothetical protein
MVTVPTNVLMFFFMRESNHPTILEKKTRRLRKELGREDLRSQLEIKLPPRQVLTRSLVRPVKVACIVKFHGCIFADRAKVHVQIAHYHDGVFIHQYHLRHFM